MNATQKTEWARVNEQSTLESAVFEVTVAGITRDVVAYAIKDGNREVFKALTKVVFTARVGRGTKLHPTEATLWPKDGKWVVGLNTVVLNRQARIVGWREDREGTSQHSGSVRYYK